MTTPVFRFIKRPVQIVASQWFKDGDHPAVMKLNTNDVKKEGYGAIATLEGVMEVRPSDWVITGIRGEHYPCRADIFEQTYALVGAA